jgi:hypothetical protein
MNSIHADTPVCTWHINQLELTDVSLAMFHVPYPFDNSFEIKIKQATDAYDQVVVLCSELHRDTVDFIKNNQYLNLTYAICGDIHGVNTYPWMDWFITTLDFYRSRTELLEQLTPHVAKEFHFDILLGCTRTHRDIVYNFINSNHLNSSSIMSYYRHANIPIATNTSFIQEPGVKFVDNITHSVGMVEYMGRMVNMSKIIPINIYNQSAYSIVAETNAENDFVFYTEKIVKPILAQRLFIVLAGYHYLKNLRNMGFKTFNSVIDESYDDVEDNDIRYRMACEQILKLRHLPQQEVLDKIKPIVEHNKKVMLETDWLGQFQFTLKEHILGNFTVDTLQSK